MPVEPHRMSGVALITGAASGIGRATAQTFVKEGCTRLILADLNLDGLQSVAEELTALDTSVTTALVQADVSQEVDAERMVAEGVAKFGAVHYAVHNAGVTSRRRVPTHELEADVWDEVVNVCLRGVWLCQRAVIRQMLSQEAERTMRTGAPPQRGAIVNLSSIFAMMTHPTCGGYAAAKAGVLGQTRTDAIAYANDGIRINAVMPGSIFTPMAEASMNRGVNYNEMISNVPMKRWGRPEEIAEAIVFLCSEKASFITGTELCIDGGRQYAFATM